MKPIDYLRRHCKCWKPTLARRITIYFSVFGLVVFAVTAVTPCLHRNRRRRNSRIFSQQGCLVEVVIP
jgi:hypothetical protein